MLFASMPHWPGANTSLVAACLVLSDFGLSLNSNRVMWPSLELKPEIVLRESAGCSSMNSLQPSLLAEHPQAWGTHHAKH